MIGLELNLIIAKLSKSLSQSPAGAELVLLSASPATHPSTHPTSHPGKYFLATIQLKLIQQSG